MVRTPGESKREPRVDVRKPAIVINSDGVESVVTILDISSNGFRIELDDQLNIGEFVALRVEGERMEAQIRWVLGKEAGGTFLARVDSSTM